MLYRSWLARLPAHIEVCPVELPGRGQRLHETAYNRLLPMVQATAEALFPYLDKPFAFFGHSLGALLAFELTRLIRRHGGHRPVHLFVSACSAPQVETHEPPLHLLPDTEFVRELQRLGGTPAQVLENRELMEIFLPCLRADCAACETYRYEPEPRLDVPITAFGGADDTMVTGELLEGWRLETTAAFTKRMLPGKHFFFQEQEVSLLAHLVRVMEAELKLPFPRERSDGGRRVSTTRAV